MPRRDVVHRQRGREKSPHLANLDDALSRNVSSAAPPRDYDRAEHLLERQLGKRSDFVRHQFRNHLRRQFGHQQFIDEWNEIAHPFNWTAKSFEKILKSVDDPWRRRPHWSDGITLPSVKVAA